MLAPETPELAETNAARRPQPVALPGDDNETSLDTTLDVANHRGDSVAGIGEIAAASKGSQAESGQSEVGVQQFTVLFADLVGFTALSDRLDAEDVRIFLNELMQESCDAIYQMRGCVEKFLGDAVVAIFRAPAGTGIDVERAVRTALLLRQRVHSLNHRWEHRLGHLVQLHIGIDTGGVSGGDAISTASALQSAASADEILVGPTVREFTDYLCVFEPRPPLPLKTPGRTVQPFRLINLRPEWIEAMPALGDADELPTLSQRSGGPPGVTSIEGRTSAESHQSQTSNGVFRSADGVQRLEQPGFTQDFDGLATPERTRESAFKSEATRAPEDERRQVTVLFADLAHSADLEELLGLEIYRAFLNDLMHALGDVVYQYEGTVQKFFGDAIMAIFGAPVAHEDDPERAVRAALGMLAQVRDLNTEWADRFGQQITLQIGVNTGEVVAGEIGLGSEVAYAVTGDTINTAARLRSAAAPGQVLVGPDSYRLTQRLCDFAVLPPIALKGKSKPVQAYALRGLLHDQRPGKGLEYRGISSPLVGREAEMATFLQALEAVAAGKGGILAIWGEAGVGKSRLVAEARSRSASLDILWLEGRTLSFTKNLSYWAFLVILKNWAGINEEDPEPLALSKLQSRLQEMTPEVADETLPYLASMMALDLEDELAERVRYLDSEAMRRQIFRAMRRWIETLARRRPLVLMFEDLHWLDESSMELIEHLLPVSREAPLLFCGVGRPDAAAASGRLLELVRGEYSESLWQIQLAPLTASDSAHLLHNLLTVDNLPVGFRDLILNRADGNPFFVEEVIRHLIDTRAVVRDPRTGRWKATDRMAQTVIPETIQGVIMARVDRLPDNVKQILRLACVVGRSFFYRVLCDIAESDRELDQGLSQLQEFELIREKTHMPELEYIFKHALVQDATYNSMLRQRRQDLHRRVADSIENLFSDRLDEFYGLIAYHAARAEDWERAQEYLFKAADQAGKIAADTEALAQYEQAMSAYARVFGDRWEPFQRAVLERKIGEALFRRVELERARDGLYRALTYLGSPFPTSPWKIGFATLQQLLVQVGHRRLQSFFLPAGTPPRDPAGCERAIIYHNLCWIDFWLDIQRLPLDGLLMLNEAERVSEPICTVRGHQVVGLLSSYLRRERLAEYHYQHAVTLAEQIQQPVALGQAYLGMGMHRYAQGEWDRASEAMQRSQDAYWKAGDLRGWGAPMNYIAWIRILRGDLDGARTPAEELAQVGEDGGDRQLAGWGVGYRGSILMRSGELEESVSYLQESGRYARSISDHVSASMADADLGRCYLRQHRIDLALEVLEATNRTLDELKTSTGGCTTARAALAEAYLAAVDDSEGAERAAFTGKAWSACAATLKLSKIHYEGLLSGCRVRGSLEWLRGRRRAAHHWWRKGIAACEHVGACPDLAETHDDIIKRTGESPIR